MTPEELMKKAVAFKPTSTRRTGRDDLKDVVLYLYNEKRASVRAIAKFLTENDNPINASSVYWVLKRLQKKENADEQPKPRFLHVK